jgi:Membrane-associated sensor, integral membrane domain
LANGWCGCNDRSQRREEAWLPAAHQATTEWTVFLSTLPASVQERRSAKLLVLALFVLFLLAAPFAQVKLAEIWPFIPSYQSALLVNDLITAILLFAQFVILGAPALLVLAGGYLFVALMSVPHALSFPRLFGPAGLIGAGPQTTAWLYMIWHAGFPLGVIAYTYLGDSRRVRRPWLAVAATSAIVLATVCTAALLTTVGHELLPAIMRGDAYTPVLPIVTGAVWSLSLLALLILWQRRAYSVLDVWLMVVMSAWVFEIGLSAMLNAGRFDLGFYAGRLYGLMAATLVLLVLLIKTGAVYARMARSFKVERDDRDRQLLELQSELIHVARLTELGQMVSAIAHEVNQPLTAAGSYVRPAVVWSSPATSSGRTRRCGRASSR